jgi:hypothetical protein
LYLRRAGRVLPSGCLTSHSCHAERGGKFENVYEKIKKNLPAMVKFVENFSSFFNFRKKIVGFSAKKLPLHRIAAICVPL